MSKISAEDIELFGVLGEFFNRAMASPADKNPIQTAEAVLVNIVSHADTLLQSGADNLSVAIGVLNSCLARCIETAQSSTLPQAQALAREISETSAALTNSR